MQALITIPARYGSTRLPGKPLAKIAGHTLLSRVVAIARGAARLAGQCDVVVATDDDRIAAHAYELGVEVAMTAAELDSGSARAFAAARQCPTLPDLVINLQGDAPFIAPETVAGLIHALRNGNADVATPVYRLSWEQLDNLRRHKQAVPFSGTCCIRGANGQALWFSKNIIPAIRGEDQMRATPLSPVWQHMGLYGYRLPALEWFASAPPGHYEQLEGLEQLRFLENGRNITTIEVETPRHAVSGIDSPEDVTAAEASIARFGDPLQD